MEMRKIFWWAKLARRLVRAVFDFSRESKRGAIKHGERKGGGEGSNDWPKEANNPRGFSLFTSREMPLELKSRIRFFFKFVIRLCRARPARRASCTVGENATGCWEILTANFSVTRFHGRIPSREFSRRRASPLHIFSGGVNCPVSRISRYALSICVSLFLGA